MNKETLLKAFPLLVQDSGRYQYTAMLKFAHLEAKKKQSKKALVEFRKKAVQGKKFELIRQADFFRLEFINSPNLFCRLYHGTPYSAFKDKLLNTYPQYLEFSKKQWFWGDRGPVVNVKDGTVNCQQIFKAGSICHQTFQALFYDLYRPRPLSVIHELISEEVPFIPVHTPNRIKQIVYRLNKELQNSNIQAQINIKRNFLLWKAQEPLQFIFEEGLGGVNLNKTYLKFLVNRFGTEPFTRRDSAFFGWPTFC